MNGTWHTVHRVTGVFQWWSTGLWPLQLLPVPPVKTFPTSATGCGSREPGSTQGSRKPSLFLMGTALGTFMAVLMTLMLRCSRNHEALYGNEAKTSPGKMPLAREPWPAASLRSPQQL